MLIDLTYACKMGCTHCLSDCKPDGQHMSVNTLKDVLAFMIRHRIPAWFFSGGEIFEHPDILIMLNMIENARSIASKYIGIKIPITFITNGRELVRNKDIYNAVVDMQKKIGKSQVLIQVTDDPRFYPDPLSDKEKYWLKKLNAVIDPVPNNPSNKDSCLYPQGRALVNFPDANWNTIAPKCANCRLIAIQKPDANFSDLINILMSVGKFCTPVIAPDGSIKIGESALCPEVANIHMPDMEIMDNIRYENCKACKIAWKRLENTNANAAKILQR